MKTLVKHLIEALRREWQRRELERELARLDPRMLKDIGLESWRNEGARLWAHRIGL
jgi:uncharacterized protein YjiS (DUF1127 family)